MELTTHLTFSGQCEAALKFYEKCLGGKITFLGTWGDSPMADQAPPEWRTKVSLRVKKYLKVISFLSC